MIIDIGSDTSEAIVVRRFIRKKKSTIITISAPSRSDDCRLLTELDMKSLWRNISSEICTYGGRVAAIEFSSSSMRSVSWIVAASGCLVTVSNTAGRALTEAEPSRGELAPIATSAISFSVTTDPAFDLTTVFARSSQLRVLTTPFMIYSLPNS